MSIEFKGVYCVAVTPFRENGEFDYGKAKAHVDYLIENGVHGLVLLGATGEYMSVGDGEHKEYVREMAAYVGHRVPVIVGATRERPDDAIGLALNAKLAGADAAMVLPPYYCHPSQAEVVENYRYIGEKTEFPLMAYNNPGSCGISLERETLREIFKIPQVRLVKESSGSIQKLTEVLADAPPRIAAFCGCDTLPLESFAIGSPGWICMLANVAPRNCVALFDAVYSRRDMAEGMEIYRRILPALAHLESYSKPVQSLKYLLNRKTGNGGYVRRPRRELGESEKAFVAESMRAGEIE
ncbi:MAG: dihydrodipicolinate synthase family protein [Clostridiales bacterium]|jgi:4-hydroxy-tetrahydrodipicolinate synthase|nr:dihydrodipicolinate synthase family protein [Clostridiales bacterium]